MPFNQIIQTASKIASSEDCWVTFGIKPTEPQTGYGYIKAIGEGEKRAVVSFTEKPDLKTAERYLAEGNYYWNSGIFVVKAANVLRASNSTSQNYMKQQKSAGITEILTQMK